MQKTKASIGLGIIGGVALGVWFCIAPRGATLSVPNVASAVMQAVSGPLKQSIHESVTIQAGRAYTLSYEFPRTPGRLYGSWGCRGSSAGIRNATDDTLVAFKLIGPNDEILQRVDYQAEGNFDIRINSPGRYTFVLDNGGIVRMSPRVAQIDAMYESD